MKALTIGLLTTLVVLNSVIMAQAQDKPRITPTEEEIAAWSREGGLPSLGAESCRQMLWVTDEQRHVKNVVTAYAHGYIKGILTMTLASESEAKANALIQKFVAAT